jgi:ABC-type microcin C transport system permease subunit YejB
MVRYLVKQFLLTLPALWLVLTLLPGDPVEQMLGEASRHL